ncbi:MAG: CPBP family intramembrane metalloprotease [Cyanobacteria bacterium REEB67]|nr:CPBP family intramembrane metalloprotease [Cyanobacteria bacterium REEB67]
MDSTPDNLTDSSAPDLQSRQERRARITRHQILIVVWTVLPWLLLSLGLDYFKSILWSFFLYHCCCLMPIIIYRRKSWQAHLIRPTGRQFAAVVAAALLLVLLTFILHHFIGRFAIERQHALAAMSMRGFQPSWLVPLSIYFVTVNPIIEELFWRGVVLNDLCEDRQEMHRWPYIWTNISFAAWHLLIIRLFVSAVFIPLALATVAAVGFFMSWLYRRTGSVIVPILWHGLVFDLAVIVILWLIV